MRTDKLKLLDQWWQVLGIFAAAMAALEVLRR